ncbi:MAG: dihydrolipoyl dehydrogenase family protein [Streptosporangiaceae bacterium]|jgi:pyruvate/2-oxoglutarate dehydrogenase complex dihydrolipoamide dehydrogenase (E3) component
MSELEFDVIVLGLGPGGEDAAERLADAGLQVAGVEARLVGGECPYWGCVPSKMMIRAANLLAEGRRIPGMAGDSTVLSDWSPVARRIRDEATDNWDDAVAADRFTGKGGRLFRGHGTITAPGVVTVGGEVLRARRGIIIGTGTAPAIPPIPGLAGTPYWTNREAIETEHVPGSLLVLGGGAIGAELAQVFARFMADVTVIEALGQLVPLEEPEAGELIAQVFQREGIGVRTGVAASSVAYDGGTFTVTLATGEEVTGERLLIATGRRADLAAVGVGAVGLDEKARAISVDEHMRAAPGVWALGDVVGKGAFTHMSMYHSEIIVADILGQEHHGAEYQAVPRVTFTDPEVGAVGLTEAQARERGLRVNTGQTSIPASSRGWIHKAGNDGFIKLVADADRGVLVGATSVGPVGGEVLSMLTLAVHAGIPVRRLDEMIYAYPTFHRAVQSAVRDLS